MERVKYCTCLTWIPFTRILTPETFMETSRKWWRLREEEDHSLNDVVTFLSVLDDDTSFAQTLIVPVSFSSPIAVVSFKFSEVVLADLGTDSVVFSFGDASLVVFLTNDVFVVISCSEFNVIIVDTSFNVAFFTCVASSTDTVSASFIATVIGASSVLPLYVNLEISMTLATFASGVAKAADDVAGKCRRMMINILANNNGETRVPRLSQRFTRHLAKFPILLVIKRSPTMSDKTSVHMLIIINAK